MVRQSDAVWGLIDVVRRDGTVAPPGTVGKYAEGEKCRCRYCGSSFGALARLARGHLAGAGGQDVQACTGPVRRENEDEASFTQRNSSYLAAKAACQQAIAKTQQQASAAKEKAALERLTSETGKTLQDAPTWLSKLGQGQQQRADEALTLGLASVGIAPFVLANPDFKAALKEVALCGKGYVIPHRRWATGPRWLAPSCAQCTKKWCSKWLTRELSANKAASR